MRSKQPGFRRILPVLVALATGGAALPAARGQEAVPAQAPPAPAAAPVASADTPQAAVPTPGPTPPGPGETPPAADDTARDSARDAAQQLFLRLLDEGRDAEAVAAAREVVELTRQASGDDSPQLAVPLTNLATAQLRAGDLLAAESNYKAAIGLIERSDGIVSPRLINPLTGLGDVYVRGEQYAQATEAYGRALRINHVNEGFYNVEQFRIRDGLTEGYLGQRDLEKANFNQETQVAILRRRLGKGNPELTPALLKLGSWYERTSQPEQARYVYQETARVIEQAAGPASPDLVDPLIALAGSYRQQALLPPDPDATVGPQTLLPMSSAMLRRALVIVDQQRPPDPGKRAQILVALGDLYQLWGKLDTAADRYREAWAALDGEALAAQRAQYFDQPVRLFGPTLPLVYPPPAKDQPPLRLRDLEPGYVVLRYAVDATGRVTDATVVEADPAGLLEDTVSQGLRRTLFRPRLSAGAPAEATGVTLRHEFRYSPKAAAAARPRPADEAPDQPLPPPGKAGPGEAAGALPPPPSTD